MKMEGKHQEKVSKLINTNQTTDEYLLGMQLLSAQRKTTRSHRIEQHQQQMEKNKNKKQKKKTQTNSKKRNRTKLTKKQKAETKLKKNKKQRSYRKKTKDRKLKQASALQDKFNGLIATNKLMSDNCIRKR